MSLISLLIALAAEKTLSAKGWQFNFYYGHYLRWLQRLNLLQTMWQSKIFVLLLVAIPTLVVAILAAILDEPLINFIFSTLVLIVCFGCATARASFKAYLMSAFRGDLVSCDHHERALRQGQDCQDCETKADLATSFGQTLIWLNYRYYFAVMVFFLIFGAAGAVFYRLLVTVAEHRQVDGVDIPKSAANSASAFAEIIDWLPVRLAAIGYMLVGHFSNAMPVWIENLLDFDMSPQQFITKIAKKAEDYMVDQDDCTAEPCLLVRLAKRNMLLFLAVISVMTLSGTLV